LAAASTHVRRRDLGNHTNCGASHPAPMETNLFEADHLNNERMFDACVQRTPDRHAAARYERMHALGPMLLALIGAPLPPGGRRRRRTCRALIEPSDRRAFRRNCSSLIEKFEAAPDMPLRR